MKVNRRSRRDARRLYHLCVVNGLLDPQRVRDVVARVSESGHRQRLAVLTQFRRYVKLDCDRHTARVQSALPLPADLRATIEGGLADLYGPGLSTTYADDAALLGGVRIQVASDVYDGTLSGALATLAESF
jgi:F-type H+-transporting ATPase subunit delta